MREKIITCIPHATAVVILLGALLPGNPYGYYIFLRWVSCAVFSILAFRAQRLDQRNWSRGFVVLAIIYNPLFRVHLTRFEWTAINLVTIVATILSARIFLGRRAEVCP